MKRNQDKPKTNRVPTISRVEDDTLIELVYDPAIRKTALVVSRFRGLWNIEQEVRIGVDEILVPYSPTNNLISNACVLFASKPVEYGLKHELLADIQAFLHRYVDLTPAFEQIAAHYVLLTWVYDRFNEVPYLRLRGEYGTGKTRALTTLGALCYKPFFASGASTVSPIFHTLDAFGGTLVLDEADLPLSDARVELVKILNNGHGRGMPVLRSIQNRDKEFNPTAFKVFGPKIIAMRDRFQDQALESRFLTEETGTRRMRPDIPVQLSKSFWEEALALRNRLLHFRLCEYFNVGLDAAHSLSDLDPRLSQITLPLLSLVDDPVAWAAMQGAFIAQNERIVSFRRETPEAEVIAAALSSFSAPGIREVAVGAITQQLNADQGNTGANLRSSKWVGHILRSKLRVIAERRGGVFMVPISEKQKLETLAHRYGIVDRK